MTATRRLAPVILCCCSAAFAAAAHAHDIPNARVDRSIQVTLEPQRVAIDYEVSLSELTLTRDLRSLIGALPGAERRDWFDAYGRETGPLNGKGLAVAVDGRPLELRLLGFDLAVEDHPRFVFHYAAATPASGRLTVHDTNYAGSEGTSRLAVRGARGVTVRGDDLPGDAEAIALRPVWQLSDAEERRTHFVAVDFQNAASAPEARPLERPRATATAPPTPSPESTALSRLLDQTSSFPLVALVALALGLGAVHALQPGHGKTLVAAAVLGERGTWTRGVLLALVTTLTHTGTVLLVAIVLWWTQTGRYGAIHLGLAHAAGFLIAAIGLWRMGRHLAGYGEHDAPGPQVKVDPDAEPDPPETDAGDGSPGRGLVGLGIAGGLVPCWDAVILIVLAEATGRLALGIALLVAFGMGMALVLVAVGVLAARIRRQMVGTHGRREYGHWERRLGVASGLALAVIGIYLLALA
jgi:ABC-type nickel/cobalt efflux system permease component RcnA